MCAILDNDRISEVFGSKRTPAGVAFRDWLDSGRGRLVLGGRLRKELVDNYEFRNWLREALLGGRAKSLNDDEVERRTVRLKSEGVCKSDDPHTVALAQLSNARLLYTNDVDLMHDFRNGQLVKQPRGKVYSTKISKEFKRAHKQLLNQKKLCNPF